MTDLYARIARASVAQGVTTLLGKAANLLLSVVLARLLYPEDYGLFTITLIVTGLANMVSNFGFQSYIIQAKDLTQDAIDTCYTLNIVFSAALGAVVAAVGQFWRGSTPTLTPMLTLYGVYVFLSGLTYIQIALLKRRLEFTLSARLDVAYTIVSMSGRVGFAAAHLGALCFPLGDVLGALVRWVLVRRMGVAPLGLKVPGGPTTREALWFGMHATSVGLASFVANQTDKVLLSSNHPVASVGFYAFGSNTAGMFYNAFIVPQTGVFLSSFARLREDQAGARALLATSTRLIFSVALPLSALWLLEPRRLLEAFFGERWVPAAPLIQVFALDYLMRAMFSGITGLQISFGLAGAAARTKWINALFFVVLLLAATALHVGIVGYALAYVTANLFAALHNVGVNGRLLAIHWGAYARNLLPPLVIGLASTLAWALVRSGVALWPLWPALIVLSGTWLMVYALLSIRFNDRVFRTFLGVLRHRGLDPL